MNRKQLRDPQFWRGLLKQLVGLVVVLGLFTAADAQFFESQGEVIIGAVVALVGAVAAIIHYANLHEDPPQDPPSGDGGDPSPKPPVEPTPMSQPTHPLLGCVLIALLLGGTVQAQEQTCPAGCDCSKAEAGVCFFWRRQHPEQPKRDVEVERLREDLRDLRAEVRGLRSEMLRPIYQLPPGGTPQQVLPPGGTPRQVLPDGGQPQQVLPPGGRILIELPGGSQPRQQIGGTPAPGAPQGGTPGTPIPPGGVPDNPGTPQQVLPGGGATPAPIILNGGNGGFIRYSLYKGGQR